MNFLPNSISLAKYLKADFLSEQQITKITADSREVIPGAIFFAIQGHKVDARNFIKQAVESGAIAIVVEGKDVVWDSTSVISVDNIRESYANALSIFYGSPSSDIYCIGVTGTNGKTSVSWILTQAFLALGKKSALCGTLGIGCFNNISEANLKNIKDTGNTTPDPSLIQRFLATARDNKIDAAFFEVTSHSIDQQRLKKVNWDQAIFTNLTRDHLDYHGDMENYARCKRKFFTTELTESNKQNKVAILNIDDLYGKEIIQELKTSDLQVLGYSATGASADLSLLDAKLDASHSEICCSFQGKKLKLQSSLIGKYNIDNLLAATLSLFAFGFTEEEIVFAISQVKPVPGRLERVPNTNFNIYVDYAHTPDALVQAQRSLKEITKGRLITIFGCGGDRDRGKRPLMGEAVAEYADFSIVTSDNPRSEDPEKIVRDIIPGLENIKRHKNFSYQIEIDRKKAISKMLDYIKPDDVALIAGKGHEDYQIIADVKYPFSDVEVCKNLIKEKLI